MQQLTYNEVFVCEPCNSSFANKQDYDQHTYIIHDVRKRFPEEHYIILQSQWKPVLCVHRLHKFIICAKCCKVIVPSSISSHIAKKHLSSFSKQAFESELAGLNIIPLNKEQTINLQSDFANFDQPPDPIIGLPLYDGKKCPTCRRCFGNDKSYDSHTHQDGSEVPEVPLEVCAQYLLEYTHWRIFFQVKPQADGTVSMKSHLL
jgi:hypothetical protein